MKIDYNQILQKDLTKMNLAEVKQHKQELIEVASKVKQQPLVKGMHILWVILTYISPVCAFFPLLRGINEYVNHNGKMFFVWLAVAVAVMIPFFVVLKISSKLDARANAVIKECVDKVNYIDKVLALVEQRAKEEGISLDELLKQQYDELERGKNKPANTPNDQNTTA